MSDANTTALADLLRSHPEECAAVAIVFAIMDYQSGGIDAAYARDEVRRFNPSMPLDRVREILTAMVENGVLLFNQWGEHRMARDDRAAIARMGAAAWLRERVTGSRETGAGAPAKGER